MMTVVEASRLRTALSEIDLETAKVNRVPFPHFNVGRALDLTLSHAALKWFETSAPWRLVEQSFYEQYEFNLLEVEVPAEVQLLISIATQHSLRTAMSELFACRLRPDMTVVAHKLTPGQRIAIHNDYLEGEETHRLLLQLNRGLTDADGGFFMLFNSADAADISAVHRPLSGSAIGFEIGPSSFHAVSRMHGGERYTLVYSFHRAL